MNALQEIILSGNAYERGVQHGLALGEQIRAFLQDHEARINKVRVHPLEKEQIRSIVAEHAVIIEAQLPEIAEELRGLATGAGISYHDAVLLQIRVELIGYKNQEDLEGDCSTVAVRQSSGSIITGQTIDLPGDMAPLGCIFRIMPGQEAGPEILMYGFAGLLGYIGLNSFGLSVNINMVLSDDWQPGVSPYLIVRHLLTLDTIDSCKAELQRLCRSSSRSFLITDRGGMVNVECTAVATDCINAGYILHTNHFLTGLSSCDSMNFLFRNSSIKRLRLLEQLLPAGRDEITPDLLFRVFSDHSLYPVGICAHGEDNIRRSETVGAVVMLPQSHLLYARKGHACTGSTAQFRLSNKSAFFTPLIDK